MLKVGAMVVYILDALQYREAALLAVWLILGLMNMCFGLTAVFFNDSQGIFVPLMTAVINGITMFLVGMLPRCSTTSLLSICAYDATQQSAHTQALLD